MRPPAPGDSGPLRTPADAIVFLTLFVGLTVTLSLVTDWDLEYVAATASCLGSIGALVSYLIREARRSRPSGRR